jgi:hypothetical protein
MNVGVDESGNQCEACCVDELGPIGNIDVGDGSNREDDVVAEEEGRLINGF